MYLHGRSIQHYHASHHFQATTECHHLASNESSVRFRLVQIVFYQDKRISRSVNLICLHLLHHILLVISLLVINHLVDYRYFSHYGNSLFMTWHPLFAELLVSSGASFLGIEQVLGII